MPLPFPILSADEAAALIKTDETIGLSGFTPSGVPKAIPLALAYRAQAEHAAGRPFKVGLLSGASTGDSVDGALARADALSFRAPFQADPVLRAQINSGSVRFLEMHISMFPQALRYGVLGPLNWAVLEACDVTPGGGIILSTSVGASPTFASQAEKILIELNRKQPRSLLGLHDLFEPEDPPTRRVLPIYNVHDRVGAPILTVPRSKIAGIVLTHGDDEGVTFSAASETTKRIGYNLSEFLAAELASRRIPRQFLPLQCGIGDTSNSVLSAMAENTELPDFSMFTEVTQDSALRLLEQGRCTFISASALTLSTSAMRCFFDNLDFFRRRIVLRPQEISNHPELIRRLGVIAINTPIEVDLAGNVNSTHVAGNTLMNGIGGSADFTRNAYLSIFCGPSTRLGGKISTIVPVVTHVDQSEHSVQAIITEYGVADLRGRDPGERARAIIENCAHPDYREQLRKYCHVSNSGHRRVSLAAAFAMHEQFAGTGDMRGVSWPNPKPLAQAAAN